MRQNTRRIVDETAPAGRSGSSLKQRIIIFGVGEIAELADFHFTHDSEFEVAGFTVDEKYLKQDEFRGRKVVAFEHVTEAFPPEHYGLFVAVSYVKLNAVRAEKASAARTLGYKLASYLSSRATVFPGFDLKENCFILEDNTIQPFARVGSNVTLWSGNHIGHHSIIEDDVFIASHVVVSGGVRIGRGSFVGVNVTLRDHVSIGRQSVLGAGALVLEDQPDFSVVAPRGTERSSVPSTRLRGL
jgi:sugar O-acyltransferase (sialic acid O-acetyltransferase NeuD family)